MSRAPERTPSAFRLNFEQQKKRARELLTAAKAGEPHALARLSAVRPGGVPALPKLADAQSAIARELRFPSWARLKAHITAMDRQWTAITTRGNPPDADLRTLHLRCGHDIQPTLVEAGFVGTFHAHITPYCLGPVTAGPDRHELMARYIVDHWMTTSRDQHVPTYQDVVAGEQGQEEFLARIADEFERVAIWMEHDSWDQLVLVRLLAHFATAARPRVLELIAVSEYPGSRRFIGVGQLPPEALRLLWDTRRPITGAQLALGDQAWNALRSPDPNALADIAASGTPALPVLAPALHRHLRELPSLETGLGMSEQLILGILADDGPSTLSRVFQTLQHEREPLPFLGDMGMASIVFEMERAAEPPVVRTADTAGDRLFSHRMTLTHAGRAVLTGARDWHELGPGPRWVGGVQITPGKPHWRWDEARRSPNFCTKFFGPLHEIEI